MRKPLQVLVIVLSAAWLGLMIIGAVLVPSGVLRGGAAVVCVLAGLPAIGIIYSAIGLGREQPLAAASAPPAPAPHADSGPDVVKDLP